MISDVSLENYRSYQGDSFEFSPGVNIVVGPNASGKTNLIEAILVVSGSTSYRANDLDLIKFNKPWFKLTSHIGDELRVVKVKKESELKTSKIIEINNKVFKRLPHKNIKPTVLFEPNQIQTVVGSPELRRNFIDDILEQISPNFGLIRRQYGRTLAQRNRLLKTSPHQLNSIFVWNVRLSELGSQIYEVRVELIKKLQAEIDRLYPEISGKKDNVRLIYRSSVDQAKYGSDLLKKLELNLEKDLMRGFTTVGAHRDDIEVNFNGHPASEVASRGECRSLFLVLKVGEAKIIENARDEKPIMLLDDVFSELDGHRRLVLTKLMKEYQAFITTTDADMVVNKLLVNSNIVPL